MQRFLALAAATAALATATLTPALANDRKVVKAFYSDILSNPGASDLAERTSKVLAPNWQSIGDFSGTAKTREQFTAQMGGFGKLVPDLKWAPQEIIQDGNRYVVRSRFTGTPKGPLFGVDGKGRGFDAMSIDVHTVENGKIVKTYHIEDWSAVLQQLGGKS